MYFFSAGAVCAGRVYFFAILRTIGLDLTYLEDYNLPNMQQLYEAAAEALDQVLETFPYSDGGPSTLLRTYDREWKIDQASAMNRPGTYLVFVPTTIPASRLAAIPGSNSSKPDSSLM